MTMQENLKDFMKLIEEAQRICFSHPECNEECIFFTGHRDLSYCIFESPPIDW